MEAYFHLVAAKGTEFDIAELGNKLASEPNVFRHPYDADATYIVCDHPNTMARVQSELKRDPDRSLSSQGMITLRAGSITVYQQYAAQSVMDHIAAVIVPLIRRTHCELVNEYGVDVTRKYREQPEKIFTA